MRYEQLPVSVWKRPRVHCRCILRLSNTASSNACRPCARRAQYVFPATHRTRRASTLERHPTAPCHGMFLRPLPLILKPAATSHAVCKSEFMLVMHSSHSHPYQQNIPQRHATGCLCIHLSLFLKPAATSHAVCKFEFMLVMHSSHSHPYQQNIPQRHATGCSCANLMPLFKSVATIYALCRSAIMPGIRSPHRA